MLLLLLLLPLFKVVALTFCAFSSVLSYVLLFAFVCAFHGIIGIVKQRLAENTKKKSPQQICTAPFQAAALLRGRQQVSSEAKLAARLIKDT